MKDMLLDVYQESRVKSRSVEVEKVENVDETRVEVECDNPEVFVSYAGSKCSKSMLSRIEGGAKCDKLLVDGLSAVTECDDLP